jgi:hypothetical protein
MNPLHLLWIVPLSASFGVFFMAMLQIGNHDQGLYGDVPENKDVITNESYTKTVER